MLKKSGTFLFGLSMGLLGGLLAAGLILLVLSEPRGKPIELLPVPSPEPLKIYISGAVSNPGVYQLPTAAILEDALIAAGGPQSGADLTQINLAAKLVNGQHIFVPLLGQTDKIVPPSTDSPDRRRSTTRLNLNQATASELEMLPGIGPVLAKKIIEYRNENGLFQRPEDLLNVAGIGPSTYEDLKDFISAP